MRQPKVIPGTKVNGRIVTRASDEWVEYIRECDMEKYNPPHKHVVRMEVWLRCICQLST